MDDKGSEEEEIMKRNREMGAEKVMKIAKNNEEERHRGSDKEEVEKIMKRKHKRKKGMN